MSSKRKSDSAKPAIDDNSNFVRMVVYTIIGVMVVFVIAIYVMKANQPIADEEDEGDNTDKVQVTQDDGPNALIAKLQQSNMVERQLKRDQVEKHLRNHIALAEELIKTGTTDAQITDGYGEKIGALAKLNAINPDTFEEFKTFVDSLDQVEIPNIKLMGRMAFLDILLKKQLFAKGDSDFQPVFDAIETDLVEYKNNQGYANMTMEFVRQLYESDKQDEAIRLMKAIVPHFRESSNDKIKSHVMRLEGMIGMETHQTTKHFTSVANGDEGAIDRFIESIKKMCADESLNEFSYFEVIVAVRDLEKRNLYGAAKTVNQKLAEAVAGYKNENVASAAKIDTENALKRLSLLDKPFNPPVFDTEGKPYDTKGLAGEVTVVVFVSFEKPASVEVYRKFIAQLSASPTKPFRVAAFVTDEKPWQGIKFIKDNAKEWLQFPLMVTAADDQSPKPETIQQMGIQTVPFVITLDRNGIVRDIDVTQATLIQSVLEVGKGNSEKSDADDQ